MRIDYPVATDNDYAVWLAFGNHYWPALYFADAQGRIRHHHFGEGEYAQSEMVIQQLLAEAGSTGAGTEMVSVDPSGLEVPADWASLRSPENYTGYERTEGFASPGGPVPGKPHVYTAPARLGLNQWALSGDWTMEEEATTLNAAGGQIACRFHARDLNLVMGPAVPGSPVRCRVLIDGQPPGEAHGTDTDADGKARHPFATAGVPAHPPARPHHRPHLRDHLPRSRCSGLLLHLRLDRSEPCELRQVDRGRRSLPRQFSGKVCPRDPAGRSPRAAGSTPGLRRSCRQSPRLLTGAASTWGSLSRPAESWLFTCRRQPPS